MYKPFEILPHTADVQLRVYGSSQEVLFENALRGMFACTEPQESLIKSSTQRSIDVHAPDVGALLIAFLSEALYLSTVHYEVYTTVTPLHCTATEYSAKLLGTSIVGYEGPEIKAVTYHDLDVSIVNEVWQATITFDI